MPDFAVTVNLVESLFRPTRSKAARISASSESAAFVAIASIVRGLGSDSTSSAWGMASTFGQAAMGAIELREDTHQSIAPIKE